MNPIFKEDIKHIISRPLDWEKFRNSRVMITGATGMVGKYLTYSLLELNNTTNMNVDVIAVMRNP